MTTAHRPTFDPARGKDAQRGPAFHQRLQPAHTKLKFRKPGQGGDADRGRDKDVNDFRVDLLAAEAAHQAKLHGGPKPALDNDDEDASESAPTTAKRPLQIGSAAENDGGDDDDDPSAKRRRILELTRDIDADDSESEEEEDEDDSDDDDSDDEDAALQRELERVRQARIEKREKEERERAAAEDAERERDIARGNPLLNKADFSIKRRWDDDVVFKNQARGTEEKGKKKEFINDLLRSDFHKRFMNKYIR